MNSRPLSGPPRKKPNAGGGPYKGVEMSEEDKIVCLLAGHFWVSGGGKLEDAISEARQVVFGVVSASAQPPKKGDPLRQEVQRREAAGG